MKKHFIDLFIYRWRYILGYGSLVLLLVMAIVTASLYVPGGLTQSEINAMTPIIDFTSKSLAVTNLPFHLLQSAVFSLFGVSIFTIKLPAIVFSIITSIAIFFLLRRWFKPNVAILSMLIMTATSQYIFIAQQATPNILYIMYSALILLFASLILQKAKYHIAWKIGLAISVGLSLYTPYFLYINLGLFIVALIHPHTRYYLLRRSERLNWGIATAVFMLIITPLIYLCVMHPPLIADILGFSSFTPINFIENLKTLIKTYFWVTPIIINGQIMPILDFGALAIVILGLIVLTKQRHTARSYTIAAWTILALPLLIINPQLTVLVTVPIIILLAIGMEALLHEWYKLFPKNPYARGTGLVLTIGLVSIMVLSGADRFLHGYYYSPDAMREFNTDVTLVKTHIKQRPVRTLLVVSEQERPLYETLATYNFPTLDIEVTTNVADTTIGNAIVTRAALDAIPRDGWELQAIVTNDRWEAGNRLYLYKIPSDTL